jgi:23S rRNA (uracil1939-C5)-methyltransferase
MKKNDIYRVKIENWGSNGEGICRIGGMAVFVRGAAKDDLCDIRILKVQKRHAFARVETIIQGSHHRIENDCPYFDKCGGCAYRHISYEEELHLKQERVSDALKRIGGIDMPVKPVTPSPDIDGYRNKAIFQTANTRSAPVIGFYRRGSHDVIPIEHCALQCHLTNQVVRVIADFAAENNLEMYDETKHTGTLRHVFTRTSSEGQIQVCLVSATKHIDNIDKLTTRLVEEFPQISGIMLIHNEDVGNVALTGPITTLYGEQYLTDTLCGLTFRISPYSFFQINHAQTENLYSIALDFADLTGTGNVLDLYCGIGTITLNLAKKAKHVYGVEIIPEAIEDARMNAVFNEITNVDFICADAGEAAKEIVSSKTTIDLLTVDPPRKGLSSQTIEAILEIGPARIIYISCDPATLARDLGLLKEHYTVQHVQPVDMFPRTTHVECVVLMSASSEAGKC